MSRWFLLALGLLAVTASLPVAAADKAAAPEAIKHVDATGGEKLLGENKSTVVLDIRTAKEFSAGHIPAARNLDFNAADFEKQLAELDRTKTYLVHCASGGRSGRSLETFKKLKFEAVYHLDGGFNAWQRAGKPVEK